jgi:hypothetical protein
MISVGVLSESEIPVQVSRSLASGPLLEEVLEGVPDGAQVPLRPLPLLVLCAPVLRRGSVMPANNYVNRVPVIYRLKIARILKSAAPAETPSRLPGKV